MKVLRMLEWAVAEMIRRNKKNDFRTWRLRSFYHSRRFEYYSPNEWGYWKCFMCQNILLSLIFHSKVNPTKIHKLWILDLLK